MRTAQTIADAQERDRQQKNSVMIDSLPPAYIAGFDLQIANNQLKVLKGIASIRGKRVVKNTDYILNWQDAFGSPVPVYDFTYYIYLDNSGAFKIDTRAPVYDSVAYSYYHPSLSGFRYIVAFYLDSDGKYLEIEVLMGYYGKGNNLAPQEGDWRIIMNQGQQLTQERTSGSWVTRFYNGILVAGLFAAWVGCQGMFNPGDPPDATEYLPNPNFRVFNFENNYEDQNGLDDWSVKTDVALSAIQKKFGSYSLTDDGSVSGIAKIEGASSAFIIGQDQANASWWYFTNLSVGAPGNAYLFLISWGNDDLIGVYAQQTTNKIILVIKKNATSTIIEGPTISLNEWHLIAFVWDESESTAYLVVDNAIYSSACSGSWAALSACLVSISPAHYRVGEYHVRAYIDELLYLPNKFLDPNLLAQHYNHNVPWNTEYSNADMQIRANSLGDGRVVVREPLKCVSDSNEIPMLTIDSAALAVSQRQTLAHGLRQKPNRVQISLLCVNSEHGYTGGDEVFPPNYHDGTTNRVWAIAMDNINIYTFTLTSPLLVIHKTLGGGYPITMANWKFRIRYGL